MCNDDDGGTMMDTEETTRLHRCAKCGAERSGVESCEGDCYPLCGPCHDELRHEDAAVWRARVNAAERERDDLAATLETRTAEHALAMERVRELEEIIAGRTTPPTDAEIAAHHLRGGDWIVSVSRDGEPYLQRMEHWPATSTERACGPLRRGVRYEVRWVPMRDGRPCAWPTAEVSRG